MSPLTTKAKSLKSSSSSWSWGEQASAAPSSPGVYWFLDENKQVLYVGKAKNLKNRLASYKQVTPAEVKTYQMVTTAKSVKYQVLETDLDALLTEAELIQAHQPKYNILLKDDKSPLYVIITTEDFPRILTARKKQLATIYKDLPRANVFGPFQSGSDARKIIKIARRIFKFCNASETDKKYHRACFYTHLRLCSGACTGKISQAEYAHMIHSLKRFLRAKKSALIKELKEQMNDFAQAKEFEHAAAVRDQLAAISRFNAAQQITQAETELPRLEEDIVQDRLIKVNALLHNAGLTPSGYSLERIECYDISNTAGTFATASMVVFTNGKPDLSEYKRFRIKYTIGKADPTMMKEALARRFSHDDWPTPSLVIIDGGKGQLRAALSVIEDRVPTISLVKRPDRLLIPHYKKEKLEYIQLKLTPGHPISNLAQQLRDESHRFAKKYHTLLRQKGLMGEG